MKKLGEIGKINSMELTFQILILKILVFDIIDIYYLLIYDLLDLYNSYR